MIQLPTALAKIFGIFRISMRKPSNGKDIKGLTLFVMENLFYGRTTSQVFDLKGSLRNRFVRASPDKPNVVLQDENLCELMVKDPVYVREPSKRFMRAAIHNDTLFLANLNVMDYSLVIARSTNGELLVGVIGALPALFTLRQVTKLRVVCTDFIRTYTWDKRVETWMKDSGLLGGASLAASALSLPRAADQCLSHRAQEAHRRVVRRSSRPSCTSSASATRWKSTSSSYLLPGFHAARSATHGAGTQQQAARAVARRRLEQLDKSGQGRRSVLSRSLGLCRLTARHSLRAAAVAHQGPQARKAAHSRMVVAA